MRSSDGDRSFIGAHPGRAECGGRGLLDGVILAGWRTGARVQVVFQRYRAIAAMPSCEGAPVNKTCFAGTIQRLEDWRLHERERRT